MSQQYVHTTIESPVGPLLLVGSGGKLTRLHFARGRRPSESPIGSVRDDRAFRDVTTQMREYFAGTRRTFDIPLHLEGTPFQKDVWEALQEIPYGVTVSYADIARRIGRLNAVRAVGLANGANPIAIVVPCHRVIGSNGTLTGYGGGLPTKEYLLRLEGAACMQGADQPTLLAM